MVSINLFWCIICLCSCSEQKGHQFFYWWQYITKHIGGPSVDCTKAKEIVSLLSSVLVYILWLLGTGRQLSLIRQYILTNWIKKVCCINKKDMPDNNCEFQVIFVRVHEFVWDCVWDCVCDCVCGSKLLLWSHIFVLIHACKCRKMCAILRMHTSSCNLTLQIFDKKILYTDGILAIEIQHHSIA